MPSPAFASSTSKSPRLRIPADCHPAVSTLEGTLRIVASTPTARHSSTSTCSTCSRSLLPVVLTIRTAARTSPLRRIPSAPARQPASSSMRRAASGSYGSCASPEPAPIGLGEAPHRIGLAGAWLRFRGVDGGGEPDDHAVEVRTALHAIALVLLGGQVVPRDVLRDAERPGAERRARVLVAHRRHGALEQVAGQERVEARGVRRGEAAVAHDSGAEVGHIDGVDLVVALARGDARVAPDRAPAEPDIFGRERRAVGPGDALAQAVAHGHDAPG